MSNRRIWFGLGLAVSGLLVLQLAANKILILYGKVPDPTFEQLVRLGLLPALPILLIGAAAILLAVWAFRRRRIGPAWLLLAVAPLLSLAVRLWSGL
jgi:hypothetical protein